MRTFIVAGVCLIGGLACSGQPLTPAQQAQYDRVRCETVALAPLALSDADALVHSVEENGLSLEDLFAMIAIGKDNIDAVKAAFSTCRAQFPKL